MLHIYTPNFKKIGVIDNEESFIFIKNFYGIGSFEMYINVNKQYTETLTKHNIVQVGNRKDRVGFITHRSLPLNDSGKSGETLFVKGFTLDALTRNRMIVPDVDFMSFSGNQEYIMKQFVDKNMINATDESRNIKELILSENKGFGKEDKWRGRFELLSDKLEEIGSYANLGWDIYFDYVNKKYIFDILKGTNRQQNNGVREPVVFNLNFGNILSREYVEDITNSANVVYSGGSGELEEKLIQKTGNKTGFERIETYREHSNVDDINELKTLSEQTLKELMEKKTFSVNVSPYGSYKYEEDYFLGDYVTVVDNSLNIIMNTQITQIKELDRKLNGIEITFGQQAFTVLDTIEHHNKARIIDIPKK